jgi:hypothetical protein
MMFWLVAEQGGKVFGVEKIMQVFKSRNIL